MEYFEKIHVRVNVPELKMVTITVFNTFVFVFEFNTSSANTMITIKYISASMTVTKRFKVFTFKCSYLIS